MLFQSEIFVFAFLPVVLIAFHFLSRYSRSTSLALLILSSLFFYGWHTPSYVLLILSSVVFNYAVGYSLSSTKSKQILFFGIFANLALLFYCKYSNFFLENIAAITANAVPHLDIVLPLAISFFTFQQIAFLVDSYKGIVEERSFLRYCLFITFFPQLIAGPILHHSEMMPQFRKALGTQHEKLLNIAVGITIFTVGLMKKTMIADNAGRYADILFAQGGSAEALGFIGAWMAAGAYSLQIYFDFSGYADMATGLARMFGIVLPQNFNSPYKSTSIISFWRRWHMTLSRFFRDYLYLPLGGNRFGSLATLRNLTLVMFLGGLWHGASWNFVIWGLLHGAFLAIAHFWQTLPRTTDRRRSLPPLLGWGLTTLAVTVAWVPFRAPNLAASLSIWQSMAGFDGFGYTVAKTSVTTLDLGYLAVFPVGFALASLMPNIYEIMARYRPVLDDPEANWSLLSIRWSPKIGWAVAVSAGFLAAILSQTETVEFLYFQF